MKDFNLASAALGIILFVGLLLCIGGITSGAFQTSFASDCLSIGKVRVNGTVFECKRIADEVKP
ncbi:hypothetical protein [Luteibacter sp. E-22]|uniref:hypothetical protein n=1 Tax=Luteibacter sp. E-22 TaxID=3404050 RepID=UPI003CF1D8BA